MDMEVQQSQETLQYCEILPYTTARTTLVPDYSFYEQSHKKQPYYFSCRWITIKLSSSFTLSSPYYNIYYIKDI